MLCSLCSHQPMAASPLRPFPNPTNLSTFGPTPRPTHSNDSLRRQWTPVDAGGRSTRFRRENSPVRLRWDTSRASTVALMRSRLLRFSENKVEETGDGGDQDLDRAFRYRRLSNKPNESLTLCLSCRMFVREQPRQHDAQSPVCFRLFRRQPQFPGPVDSSQL